MKNLPLIKCYVLLIMLLPCLVHAKDATKPTAKRGHNTITVSNSVIHFPGIEPINKYGNSYWHLNNQYGIRYERWLNEEYSIGGGYETWGHFPFGAATSNFYIQRERNYYKTGLDRRFDYHLGDIIFTYRYNKFKKDKISIAGGPSVAIGTDMYIDSLIIINGFESYESHDELNTRIGVLSRVSYDHLFLKGRVGIGAHIACRKYFGLESVQMDYGLHLGLNF